jgi:two-component system, NarL family, nitrate/nitrite response regulator NarL
MEVLARASSSTLDCDIESRIGQPEGGDQQFRVLIVGTQTLMAEGVQVALTGRGYSVEVCGGPTARDVVELTQKFRPACVLLNLHFSGGLENGIRLIEPLVAAGSHVVMLSDERRRHVLAECLEAGASGWIAPSAALDDVEAVLRRLADGGSIIGRTVRAHMINTLQVERERERRARATLEQLTQREALVLVALIDGLTAEEIAREHFVALTTVRSQIRAVLQKLGVRSQLAAVSISAGHRDLLPSSTTNQRDRRRFFSGNGNPGVDATLVSA